MTPFCQTMGAVRAPPSKFGHRACPCQIMALREQPVKVYGTAGPLLPPPVSACGGRWANGAPQNPLATPLFTPSFSHELKYEYHLYLPDLSLRYKNHTRQSARL